MGSEELARHLQDPITVDDVLISRMIVSPFRLLQCCLVTRWRGHLTLVAAERATQKVCPW
jgi:hypothetical protein